MGSTAFVNKPSNAPTSAATPALTTPTAPANILSTGTQTAGAIDPDLARRDIAAARAFGSANLEKAFALHEFIASGKDSQRARDILRGVTTAELKNLTDAMQYVLNTRESTRVTASTFLTPLLNISEQPLPTKPVPAPAYDAMGAARRLAAIAEDHLWLGNQGRDEKLLSEIQSASPEQREQIAKAWKDLISSQLRDVKIAGHKATGNFLEDISPCLLPEQQLKLGQLVRGFNGDALAKYCKDNIVFPDKLLSALKSLSPEQIRAVDESLKKNFPKDFPVGLIQLISNAPAMGANGKNDLLALVVNALNSKEASQPNKKPADGASTTNQDPSARTPAGTNQSTQPSTNGQPVTRAHSAQTQRTTVDAHLGFVQERMLAFDKDIVMQVVREVYPSKSDEQCQRIATDGKRGPATDLAISRIRERLGMSRDGGADREFMVKLSEATPAKGVDSAPAGGVVEVQIPDSTATQTKPEATEAQRRDIVDSVKLLVDKHHSPEALLRQAASQYSEATMAQLDKELTDKHGRSIIQQMTNEKHDILPETIAAVAEILHPGKYNPEAVVNAVKLARALKDDKKDDARKIIYNLSSHEEAKNLAEAFEGLLATDDSRAKFRKQMEREENHMPIDEKDKVRFLRFVVQDKGVFKKSEQTSALVDDGPSIA